MEDKVKELEEKLESTSNEKSQLENTLSQVSTFI